MKKIIFNVVAVVIITAAFSLPKNSLAFIKTNVGVTVQNDFIVEPGKTEIFLNPGESVVKNISITSRVDRPVKFKLTAEDFVGTSDVNQPVLLLGDDNSPSSLKDFIVPEISDFTLNFGEKITIPVTISVPINAEPKGFYGALIVSNDPDKIDAASTTETQGKTRVVSRIGSLFLLRINGEGKEEGNVESLKVIGPQQLFYSSRPSGFEIAFKNTGNVHLAPYGIITVKNMIGTVESKLPVDAYFVLPNSTRYREIYWSEGFSLGRYTANLSLFRGYNNLYSEVTVAFWVIPWKILIAIIAGILILIGIIYYVSTHFRLSKK